MICITSPPNMKLTGQARRKFQRGKLPAAAGIITPHEILDLGGLCFGIVVAPRRLFRAFLRGRHAVTNLYKKGFIESRLNDITVGVLRNELGLTESIPVARTADVALFVIWCACSVFVWTVLPLLALILIWLVARRAI